MPEYKLEYYAEGEPTELELKYPNRKVILGEHEDYSWNEKYEKRILASITGKENTKELTKKLAYTDRNFLAYLKVKEDLQIAYYSPINIHHTENVWLNRSDIHPLLPEISTEYLPNGGLDFLQHLADPFYITNREHVFYPYDMRQSQYWEDTPENERQEITKEYQKDVRLAQDDIEHNMSVYKGREIPRISRKDYSNEYEYSDAFLTAGLKFQAKLLSEFLHDIAENDLHWIVHTSFFEKIRQYRDTYLHQLKIDIKKEPKLLRITDVVYNQKRRLCSELGSTNQYTQQSFFFLALHYMVYNQFNLQRLTHKDPTPNDRTAAVMRSVLLQFLKTKDENVLEHETVKFTNKRPPKRRVVEI